MVEDQTELAPQPLGRHGLDRGSPYRQHPMPNSSLERELLNVLINIHIRQEPIESGLVYSTRCTRMMHSTEYVTASQV